MQSHQMAEMWTPITTPVLWKKEPFHCFLVFLLPEALPQDPSLLAPQAQEIPVWWILVLETRCLLERYRLAEFRRVLLERPDRWNCLLDQWQVRCQRWDLRWQDPFPSCLCFQPEMVLVATP